MFKRHHVPAWKNHEMLTFSWSCLPWSFSCLFWSLIWWRNSDSCCWYSLHRWLSELVSFLYCASKCWIFYRDRTRREIRKQNENESES